VGPWVTDSLIEAANQIPGHAGPGAVFSVVQRLKAKPQCANAWNESMKYVILNATTDPTTAPNELR